MGVFESMCFIHLHISIYNKPPTISSRGRIFFPDFCHLCLRKFREFNEDHFRQELFKVTNSKRVEFKQLFNILFFSDTLWHRSASVKVSCQKVSHSGKFLVFFLSKSKSCIALWNCQQTNIISSLLANFLVGLIRVVWSTGQRGQTTKLI